MSLPVKTGFPDDMIAGGAWVLEFAAVDPTTGNDVAGVVISAVNIGGEPTGGAQGADTNFGPFMLVPGPGA